MASGWERHSREGKVDEEERKRSTSGGPSEQAEETD